jgi:dihydropteroate synthase
MGILNLTPDSFYDGGQIRSESDLLSKAERLLKEGATFLDIGGYSSRPGAKYLSEEEELNRVLPAIDHILNEFPEALLSVDTFRSSIARKCILSGAALVNDISGGSLDDKMFETIAELKVPYIMMHLRGNPENMMENTTYENLTREIIYYFSEKISMANEIGINDIIIDPGFGFSKTLDQNFELLNELELFDQTGLPVLVGLSRKSFIYKTLGKSPEEALNGTTILNSISLFKGADILRVHDVKEAVECVTLLQSLKSH